MGCFAFAERLYEPVVQKLFFLPNLRKVLKHIEILYSVYVNRSVYSNVLYTNTLLSITVAVNNSISLKQGKTVKLLKSYLL